MDSILLIDDDDGLTHFLGRFFRRKGYSVETCTNGQDALQAVSRQGFDLILLDYRMPGMNGLDVLKRIKEAQVKTPVILMTAYGSTDTAIEATKRGAYDYLVKPFDRNELSRVVSEALLLNRRMKETVCLPAAREPFLGKQQCSLRIIGQSRKMQEVYKAIGQVAEKDVAVLIEGESGTGKELVARAIYHHSLRREGPFIAINCAAIPETLFESELFGHEKGAFTGAERTNIGKIERADGGTFFLDEIGELSMNLQAKLLRVLQEGELERVGGRQPIKVDVRFIAATNKNLELEVKNGRFREDLYWRLKIITIHMPPLRERTEDIPELVDYFLERFGREYGKSIGHVSEGVLKRFQANHWPGNVRALENCIRRAILLCSGEAITEDHVASFEPASAALHSAGRDQLMVALKAKLRDVVPDILRLSEQGAHANLIELMEETMISSALEQCGNNQVKAARMLGISRNTLRHRIRKALGKPNGGGAANEDD
jgi:two-component system, NtrC family, response regulator AtoC